MTKENKDILLKYLCMALPYDCMLSIAEGGIGGLQWVNVTLNSYLLYQIEEEDGLEYIKPYLLPMSSMTMEDLQNLSNEIGLGVAFDNEKYELWLKGHTTILDNSLAIDWLLKNHFDFMGLIEKGLALEAPEGTYKHIV